MADDVQLYQRVQELDDPNRCQSPGPGGQCKFHALEGSGHCHLHSPLGHPSAIIKKDARNYRLGKYQQRMEEFADNDKVKSLREEIGIIRMISEEILNKCNDATDILMYSGRIADLVMKTEKLVSSCQRLESSTGLLLDKTALLNLASVIINIISSHVADELIIDRIATQITESILHHNELATP